jgi:hypothetical protein
MHEARSSTFLGEFGEERGSPFLKRRELGPERLRLAVDPLQLCPGLLFPQIPLTMPAVDQILDLAPDTPIHRS